MHSALPTSISIIEEVMATFRPKTSASCAQNGIKAEEVRLNADTIQFCSDILSKSFAIQNNALAMLLNVSSLSRNMLCHHSHGGVECLERIWPDEAEDEEPSIFSPSSGTALALLTRLRLWAHAVIAGGVFFRFRFTEQKRHGGGGFKLSWMLRGSLTE